LHCCATNKSEKYTLTYHLIVPPFMPSERISFEGEPEGEGKAGQGEKGGEKVGGEELLI
jgi:hypothetical protein